MRHMAEVLDQVTGTIRRTYLAKTHMAETLARHGRETWYSAREALAAGSSTGQSPSPSPRAACGSDLSFKRPPARSR